MSGWRKRQIADKIDNAIAGGDIHAGDGGYSEGTKEAYEQFAARRNYHVSNTNNPVDFPPPEPQENDNESTN